jgi:hypothetical protein
MFNATLLLLPHSMEMPHINSKKNLHGYFVDCGRLTSNSFNSLDLILCLTSAGARRLYYQIYFCILHSDCLQFEELFEQMLLHERLLTLKLQLQIIRRHIFVVSLYRQMKNLKPAGFSFLKAAGIKRRTVYQSWSS